jgi:hypothetical protein
VAVAAEEGVGGEVGREIADLGEEIEDGFDEGGRGMPCSRGKRAAIQSEKAGRRRKRRARLARSAVRRRGSGWS